MAVSCEDVRFAYLNGEVTPEIERHLAECAGCGFMREMRGLALDATGTPDPGLDATAASGAGATDAPSSQLPEAPRGRYQIADEIGKGGLGRVMRARDALLGRTVAIKEVLGGDEGTRRRFVREALITARLQHPAIVPVYDAARWSERAPFYAMKLVAGRPLSAAIDGAATIEARLALVPTVLAVADAIAYAHAERVIHRDLKPHNVMVGAFGETVVIDWGLAKDLSIDDRDAPDAGPYRDAPADHTAAGTVMGTPAYMAPEQASGGDVDERADVYAIGAILYHVVTGAPPVDGATRDEVIARAAAGEIVPIAVREPRGPADLAAIVGKAMARAAADRYPSARELADDLRRFVSGQLVAVHRYSLRELVRRWARRHRVALAVAGIAAAVLIAYGTWSVRRIVDESHRADDQRDRAIASARDAATERDRAIAQANAAIVAQARGVIDRDPVAALRLLATMNPSGPHWDAARVIAADARSRPRAIASASLRQDGRPPIEASKGAIDAAHGRAFAWSWGWLWTIDLATGAVTTLDAKRPVWPDEMIACDDGKRLAGWSATASGTIAITVYALGADAPVTQTLEPEAAWRIAADCDADDAVAVDDRGRLVAWDARARAPRVLAERGMTASILGGDHRHAIAIDARGAASVWDVSGGAPPVALGTFAGASPIATSSDGGVTVLRGPHGDVVVRAGDAPIALPAGAPTWIVAPDGAWIAAALPDRVVWRRGARFERDDALLAEPAASLALSSDGRWLVARSEARRAYAWDMAAGAWREQLGDQPVDDAAPAGPDRAITRHPDGSVRVWALAAPRLVAADPDDVTMSAEGRWIVDETDGGLRRIDASGAVPTATTAWPVAKPPLATVRLLRANAIGPDGDVIVLIGPDVWIWRRGGDWQRLGAAPEPGAMGAPILGWTDGGAPMAWADREIVVWERGGARRIAPLQTPAVRRLVAVRADLAMAAAIDTTDGTVLVLDLARGTETPLPGSAGASLDDRVGFAGGGRYLVTGAAGGDGHLLWDVATARARTIPGSAAGRASIAVSDDGARVALGTPNAVELADLAGGARTAIDTGSGRRALAFDDGWHRLVTSSDAGTTLWDVGAHEGRRLLDDGDARAIAFDAAGVTIATGHGVFRFADDLPTAPCALRAELGAPCPPPTR